MENIVTPFRKKYNLDLPTKRAQTKFPVRFVFFCWMSPLCAYVCTLKICPLVSY